MNKLFLKLFCSSFFLVNGLAWADSSSPSVWDNYVTAVKDVSDNLKLKVQEAQDRLDKMLSGQDSSSKQAEEQEQEQDLLESQQMKQQEQEIQLQNAKDQQEIQQQHQQDLIEAANDRK